MITDSYLPDDSSQARRESEILTRHFSFVSEQPIRLDLTAHDADVTVSFDAPAGTASIEIRAREASDLDEAIDAHLENDGTVRLLVPPMITNGRERGFAFQLGRFSLSLGHTARVHIEAHVPEFADARIGTKTGDVQLVGDAGRLDVKTSTGDVSADSCRGGRLESGTGDVRVTAMGGGSVSLGSGDLTFEQVVGQVSVKSGTGDVTASGLEGDLSVSTGSGDLTIRTVRAGSVQARTGSGDISVGVATGIPVWQDLASSTGDSHVRLSNRGEPAEGQPFVRLQLTTGTGDLDVHDA